MGCRFDLGLCYTVGTSGIQVNATGPSTEVWAAHRRRMNHGFELAA